MIRLLLLEDHPKMLEIIVEELKKHADIQLVGIDNHGSKLFDLVRETSPDVVILNLSMGPGDFNPFTSVDTLRKDHPDLHILILTADNSQSCIRSLTRAGVKGYILKSDSNFVGDLPKAIRTLYAGGQYYSKAVQEILSELDELQLQ